MLEKLQKEVIQRVSCIKMITVKDLLNKIKWDKREKPADYKIFYFDRITKSKIEIPYTAIKRLEGTFMILEKQGEEVNIPLHRIRQVMKKGKIIWER